MRTSFWMIGLLLSAWFYALTLSVAFCADSKTWKPLKLPFQLDAAGVFLPWKPDVLLGVGIVFRDRQKYKDEVDVVEHRVGLTRAFKIELSGALEVAIGPSIYLDLSKLHGRFLRSDFQWGTLDFGITAVRLLY